MSELRYPNDVVEFIIGPPAWSCGCRTVVKAEGLYQIVPCVEQKPELEDSE